MGSRPCVCSNRDSDAGPNPQRVDPHLLTKARIALANKGILHTTLSNRNQWHYLADSDRDFVNQRFLELTALHAQTEIRSFTDRMGDTAEIAVLKAMQQNNLNFFGPLLRPAISTQMIGGISSMIQISSPGLPLRAESSTTFSFIQLRAEWELKSRTLENGCIPTRTSSHSYFVNAFRSM